MHLFPKNTVRSTYIGQSTCYFRPNPKISYTAGDIFANTFHKIIIISIPMSKLLELSIQGEFWFSKILMF